MNWNPYLQGNVYLDGYNYLNYFTLTLVLVAMFLAIISILMLMRSGYSYTVEDAEAHQAVFAGIITEGHGGMTLFLWKYFIFMFFWTIIYFIQHAAEFNLWFAF